MPALKKQRQMDLCASKACPVYTASSKAARASQCDVVSKKIIFFYLRHFINSGLKLRVDLRSEDRARRAPGSLGPRMG